MIYPSILTRIYESHRPLIEETARRVKETLSAFCEQRGFAFVSRLKTVESIAEKIETGRFTAWSELDDLFACTVIIPTLRHESDVITFCESTFETKVVLRGDSQKAPEVFRFDSTRLRARLRKPEGVEISEPSIYSIKFEVQVKTAFEHAWSVSTHDLAYKSRDIDWKRQRLAAQLKAVVEQLDMLILGYEQTMDKISESPYFEIERKRKISDTFTSLFQEDIIPAELKPKDLSRFCDNVYALLKSVNKEDKVLLILEMIEKHIRSTEFNLIPRSISLFQYTFAILVRIHEITSQPRRFHCHITEEMESLFPEIKQLKLQNIFQYNS